MSVLIFAVQTSEQRLMIGDFASLKGENMSLQKENLALTNKNRSHIACVSSEIEKNDGANFGQSLIKFMNLATGSVKTALQKPENYKKNINHRRYLQKQLKICTRRKKRNTNTKTKTGPRAKKDLNAATEVWMGQANCGEVYIPSEAVRSEEFSSYNSLFLPYEASFNGMQGQSSESHSQNFSSLANGANLHNGMVWNSFVYSGQEQTSISLQQANINGALFRDDMIPDILDEETEQFLTGEELTDALDIKDLFRPDRVFENDSSIMSSCTFDENMYNCFQTVPSTASILSW